MSFLRHKEIYPFDGGAGLAAGAPAHRLDEFPAGYSLAGWSPPLPASASPTASEYEAQPPRWSTDFQRTAKCVLTICVSSGGSSIFNFMREAQIWYSRVPAQRTLSAEFENVIVLSDESHPRIDLTSGSERSRRG